MSASLQWRVTHFSEPPLHFACVHGHYHIARLLIESGAKIFYDNFGSSEAGGLSEVIIACMLYGLKQNLPTVQEVQHYIRSARLSASTRGTISLHDIFLLSLPSLLPSLEAPSHHSISFVLEDSCFLPAIPLRFMLPHLNPLD